MLTGKELGAAIEAARIAKGVNKKQLADAFGVKPPSVQGWVTTGRIDKAKLMELIAYFSDTVGPEHWGLSAGWFDHVHGESPPEPARAEQAEEEDKGPSINMSALLKLKGKASPRSLSAIQRIEQAARQGRLKEEDVLLLEGIAARFEELNTKQP